MTDGIGVDGQTRADAVEGDALKSDFKVAQGIHGHAHAAHFALGLGVVRVQAHLGGQVEGDVEPGLPVVEIMYLKRWLVSSGVPKPVYCRVVQARLR